MRTELAVGRRGDTVRFEETPVDRSWDGLQGSRVAEFDAVPGGSHSLLLRLLGPAGAVVAERAVHVEVHQDTLVTVRISRTCEGVFCPGPGDAPELTTCLEGRCVDPACSEERVDACGPPSCDTRDDCPDPAACASSECVSGVCLFDLETGRCPAGQWCHPALGCMLTEDVSLDAGAPTEDAGAGEDAGTPTPDTGCPSCPVAVPLGDDTAVDLRTLLDAMGAPTDRPIQIDVPAGVTVGSTDSGVPALSTGDLGPYSDVTLVLGGRLEGAPGAPNGGDGGPALELTSPVTVVVTPTGAILGGGGGGGRGGNGGMGSDRTSGWASRTASVFGADQIDVAWYRDPDNTNCGVRDYPDNFRTNFSCGRWSSTVYDFDVDQIVEKGGYWRDTALGWEMYHFRIANHGTHGGGAGGNGGFGVGFGQPMTTGEAGGSGQRRSGDGGRGGDGGDWGSPGATGGGGGTGQRYTYNNSSASDSGSGGSPGGAPGAAIACDGLTITLDNQGTIAGEITCTTVPP